MLFWLTAAAILSAALAAVLAPLWRRTAGGAGRASHDLQVLHDQLREVESDVARGLLTTEEATATRTEVSRRLLAAAGREAAGPGLGAAPRLASAIAVVGVLAAGAGGLAFYRSIGAPGFPDQPRAERMRADAAAWAGRPGQAAAEAQATRAAGTAAAPSAGHADLVERLVAAVTKRPGDLEGQRLLARTLAAVGRFAEAHRAQAQVIAILGAAASGAEHVALAELMIRAADGYVSPEAEAALARGLQREPDNPFGRYLSGLALLQAGRPDLAHPIWARLLDEGPADAPWAAPVAANIDAVAAMAGLPPRAAPRGPETAVASPGPGAAEVEAAEAMDPATRAEMITGMVDRLGARLAADGGPPEDWARLVRALRVLGRTAEAEDVALEADTAFAGDPAARALISEAAASPVPPSGPEAPAP